MLEERLGGFFTQECSEWSLFCLVVGSNPQAQTVKAGKVHGAGKELPHPDQSAFGPTASSLMSSVETLVVSNM